MDVPLAVGGNRLTWHELPPYLQAAVESAAGAPVRHATNQPGGFSPGLASVLRLADGRSVFVKALNGARNPDAPDLHRREARMLAALPATVPAPRLLWSYDDGDWVALMTEAIDGRPPAHPWQPAELELVLAAMARMASELTPAPVPAPSIQQHHAANLTGWRELAASPDGGDHLDPWTRRHLVWLAEQEETWPQAATGDTLLHGDLRADNLLITRDNAVMVVDWPHACVGAAWIDVLCALPSIAMQGGGDPERLWRSYPLAGQADWDAVTVLVVAITGYFVHRSGLPAPPNLPRVRAFQRAQGEVALRWLRQRLAAGRG